MKSRPLRVLVLPFALAGLLAACSSPPSGATGKALLPARTLAAGAVEVTITPTRLDSTGATFSIVLDTHSADLSVDLATSTVLAVGGTKWTVQNWTGDGPGGHHRSGKLQFSAKSPPQGMAVLTIVGLPEPVEATWQLGGD